MRPRKDIFDDLCARAVSCHRNRCTYPDGVVSGVRVQLQSVLEPSYLRPRIPLRDADEGNLAAEVVPHVEVGRLEDPRSRSMKVVLGALLLLEVEDAGREQVRRALVVRQPSKKNLGAIL